MIKYASTDLLNIAYLEQGKPGQPVVLLLHGWPDDATTWNEVMPNLTNAGYHVVCVDHVGKLVAQGLVCRIYF